MKSRKRWELIEDLYHAALELGRGERDEFLSRACASDHEMLAEVRSLIAAHELEGSFIDSPAYEAAAEAIAESQALIAAGQTVAHYRVTGLLGKGGMGEVYLAEDSRLGRKVALKMLPERFTENRNRLARFIQEAQTASALNHPNILTIYEIGESDGAHYIATEYIEGKTLRSRLAASRLNLAEALDIAIQVASALATAHKATIVHRDIKPENIMLRPDGYVKVLDFGLAKLTESSADSRSPATDSQLETVAKVETEPGVLVGTVNYMSPEQARAVAVDERTDIFSLGIVIYEMVTARMPFRGETSMDTLVAIIEKEPPPLAHYAKGAPAELQRIITKAMRKSRDERYQTMRDLLVDLKSVREDLAFEARRGREQPPEASSEETASDERTPMPMAVSNAAASTDDRALRTIPIKKKSAAIIALAAVALVVAAMIGAIIWSRPPTPVAPAPATAAPAPAPERVLNYWASVRRSNGKQFDLEGDAVMYFGQGDRIWLNFASPQSGYLYVVNEGPVAGEPLVILFPSQSANNHSPRLAEGQQIKIPEQGNGFEFDSEEGTEKIWLVWSANPVAELEAVKGFANPTNRGSIANQALNNSVREFLRLHLSAKPEIEKHSDKKATSIKAPGETLVHAFTVEHR